MERHDSFSLAFDQFTGNQNIEAGNNLSRMSLNSRGELNSISLGKNLTRNESSAGASYGQNMQISIPNEEENKAIHEEESP